jgi:hypothetical protein
VKKISKGYVPSSDLVSYMSRRYPFRAMKEGDFIDTPYPLAERKEVVSAVGYYNRRYKLGLVISYFSKGTKECPEPHMIVGRPKPKKAPPLHPLLS